MRRITDIQPPDMNYAAAARERWNSIAKPLGSFGLLETAVERLAAVRRTDMPALSRRTAVVMCADNGVVSEGVSQCGSEVTAKSAAAIAEGSSNINALAAVLGADVLAVDIGIKSDVKAERLMNRKIAYGTENMAVGAAMTRSQAERAVSVGIDIVRELKDEGTDMIVTGEMGIGNTTAASAVSAVMLELPVVSVTGRGAGLSESGIQNKIRVIERAIEVNRPDKSDPLDVLSKVGSLDIAGMAGLFLGGAVYQLPVVIDGVISAAAAVIASEIAHDCTGYMFASHTSDEPAGRALLEKLGLEAVIHGRLRLGEGTGGILLLPLLDGALGLYRSSHSFGELGIERYVELK